MKSTRPSGRDGSAEQIGNYWILRPPGLECSDPRRVMVDTNLVLDTAMWFRGDGRARARVADIWAWIREQDQQHGAMFDLMLWQASVEASWNGIGLRPDPARVVEDLARAYEVMSWGAGTARDRFSGRWDGLSLPISQRAERGSRALGIPPTTELVREIARDWASLILLLPLTLKAEGESSIKERLRLYRNWRDAQESLGVGCSAEVKVIAHYAMFGGAETIPGTSKRTAPMSLLKQRDWKSKGVLHATRNVALDAEMLRVWRQCNDEAAQGTMAPAVLLTGDKDLAMLSAMVHTIQPNISTRLGSEIGGVGARYPERSKLLPYLEVLPPDQASEILNEVVRPHGNTHLTPDQILEMVPELAGSASRAMGLSES